jgi:HEAT repeat protein
MAANRDQPGRPYIIRALGANAIKSAIQLFLQILEDPSEDKFARCQAAEAVGRTGGSSKIFPVLLSMLEAPEEEVRLGALSGLGALRDSRAFSAIVEQLDSGGLRYNAIMALGDLGDPRACDLLIPMLKTGDLSVVIHSATAVGKLSCYDALPLLIQVHDRMTASDCPVSAAHVGAIKEAIRKLQQKKHETSRE